MPLNDTPVDEDEDMAEAAAGPSSPKLDKRTLNANTPKLVFTVEEAERNDMTVAQLIDILADDVERIVLLADGKLPRDRVPITLWLEMAVDNLQLRGRLRAALSAEFGGYLPVNAWHWLRTWLKKHVTSAEELSALSAWIKLKEQGGIQTLSELLQVIADMQRLLPRDFDQLCILQALSLVPLRLRNMLLRKTLQDGKQEDWASWAEFEQVLAAHVSAFPGYGKHAGSGGQGGTPKKQKTDASSSPGYGGGNKGDGGKGGSKGGNRSFSNRSSSGAGGSGIARPTPLHLTGAGAAKRYPFDENKPERRLYVPNQTKADRDKLAAQNKCWICEGKGHDHKTCPNRGGTKSGEPKSLYDRDRYWYWEKK